MADSSDSQDPPAGPAPRHDAAKARDALGNQNQLADPDAVGAMLKALVDSADDAIIATDMGETILS
jgi:hypothetical protein